MGAVASFILYPVPVVCKYCGAPTGKQQPSFFGNTQFNVLVPKRDCGCDMLRITVGALDPKQIEVQVARRGSVADLKMAIQEQEGIPTDQQRLHWHNRLLGDQELLSSVGINHESTSDIRCCARPSLQLRLQLNQRVE